MNIKEFDLDYDKTLWFKHSSENIIKLIQFDDGY